MYQPFAYGAFNGLFEFVYCDNSPLFANIDALHYLLLHDKDSPYHNTCQSELEQKALKGLIWSLLRKETTVVPKKLKEGLKILITKRLNNTNYNPLYIANNIIKDLQSKPECNIEPELKEALKVLTKHLRKNHKYFKQWQNAYVDRFKEAININMREYDPAFMQEYTPAFQRAAYVASGLLLGHIMNEAKKEDSWLFNVNP